MSPRTAQAIALIASTVSLALVAWGLIRRRRPRVHVPVMSTAFALDVLNVLFIEINRGAVEKALETFSGGSDWLLRFHIAVSVLCLAGFTVAAVTGRRLLRTGKGRRVHWANAATFVPLRILNYVTSFMVFP